MNQNLHLLVARRRNYQTRHLEEFLTKFSLSTSLKVIASDIVEPFSSVQAERALVSVLQQKLSNGSLTRSSELVWGEVQDCLNKCAGLFNDRSLILSLCHSNDFMVRLRFCDLLRYGKQILEFDGDTAYIFTEGLDHGIGIDMYESEISNEIRYTFDLW